ncbi:MAG: pyridoxal phosphate-dependent aminotransferase [Paracoccaceae bacterium]|nr:pyridoxal phosphate-dependent aminotransferase [Paracoccaceae bacterium]
MQKSHRISNINEAGSDGWEVFLKARKMISEGVKVTELSIGEHDIRTDKSILDAMHASALAGKTGYAMVPGMHSLRKAVAKRVQARTGVPTEVDNVLITPGGQAGLFAAHAATCDAGDRALYVEPFYATYPSTLRAQDLDAVSVPTRSRYGFQPERVYLEKHAKGARSLLINSPNNPSGSIYSRETMTMIADVCKAYDLWLISDEVYDTQIWSSKHISPRSLLGMQKRTLVIGSMSKSHAMTGSRIGWVVGPQDMISNLIDFATNTTYGVAGFVQEAALFALDQGVKFEEKIAAPFARRRKISLDILKEFPNVKAVDPQGGMYVMLDIRATGLSGIEFANRLLEQHHIAVMPGESFGQSAAGHLRVAMTIADTAYGEALCRLCQFATELVDV